jgi:hypothetical protein
VPLLTQIKSVTKGGIAVTMAGSYRFNLNKKELQSIHKALHQLENIYDELNESTLPIEYDEALSVTQLSERTGFKESQIRSWIKRQHDPLPAYNPGQRQTRVIWSQFVKWLEQYPVNRRAERIF